MASEPQSRPDGPSREQIEAGLVRVAESRDFARSPQLNRFLEFIVRESLEGRADRLKAYTIGTLALGRPASFDPASDSIVRVEANRLRRALDDYYAGDGRDDPLIIRLPAGSYVPDIALRRSEAAAPAAATGTGPRSASLPGPISLMVLALLVFSVAIGWALRSPSIQDKTGSTIETPRQERPAVPSAQHRFDRLPRLKVLSVVSQSEVAPALMERVNNRMWVMLSRFDEFKVIAPVAPHDTAAQTIEPIDNYVLRGTLERQDNGFTLALTLTELTSSRIIWSRKVGALDEAGVLEEVRASTVLVAGSYGLITSYERTRYRDGNGQPYYCILDVLQAQRTSSHSQDEAGMQCLEKAAEEEPGFSLVWSYLAQVRAEMAQDSATKAASGASHADAAYAAARRAIGADPSSARAQQSFARALHARGELANAVLVARKALELNPEDPVLQADLGAYLILSGAIEEGLRLVDAACWAVPDRPEWFDFYAFAGRLLLGRRIEAADRASRMFSMDYEPGVLARAVRASILGDRAQARSLVDRLASRDPRWRDAPGEPIRQLGFGDVLAAGLIAEIESLAAGR